MTVSITISGENPTELREAALKVAAFFDAPPTANGEVLPPKPAPEPKKRGPKQKADAPKQIDIEEVTKEVSHDDMVAELTKVNSAHGMQAVRDIIGAEPFLAQKVGDVKPEHRAAVVAAAQKKLAA